MILRSLFCVFVVAGAAVSLAATPPSRPQHGRPAKQSAGNGPMALAARACPRQAEPAPLSSAGLSIPSDGDTLLFSAAPSFQNVRFALRVTRRSQAAGASATLVRLKRPPDCNILNLAGVWEFEIDPEETKALFADAAELERSAPDAEVVLDGTTVEVQHYASGKKVFEFSSNASVKERLSRRVLDVVRAHVRASELPASPDWRVRAARTPEVDVTVVEPRAPDEIQQVARFRCNSTIVEVRGYGVSFPKGREAIVTVNGRALRGNSAAALVRDLSNRSAAYRMYARCPHGLPNVELFIVSGERENDVMTYKSGRASISPPDLVDYTGFEPAAADGFWYR